MAQQVQVTVRQTDIDAANRLLQRMYTGNQRSLPMMVFGTEQPPIPTIFQNPNDPFSSGLLTAINQKLMAVTAATVVSEWHLDPAAVDNLALTDPRVIALRIRLIQEIGRIPIVTQLNAARVQQLEQQQPQGT